MQSVKYRFGRGTPVNSLSSGHSLTTETGVLFNFNINRPTNSVTVENIPDHVNRREVVSLFNNLIGEVRSFQDMRDGSNSRLDITFFDRDSAAKALCMNGYTIANVPLTVSALTMASPVNRTNKVTTDDRRNLYVLGLPFALTKAEFTALFAQYGTVSHCVILATVDNSSRRRGFVVMSSHEEARQAMLSLTHTTIKGHTIDVSWAVVQRSQGFLDGGDRAMLLESRTHLSSPSPKLFERGNAASCEPSEPLADLHDADSAAVAAAPVSGPTTALLVTNLPTLLFSQAQDLQPLFLPFGNIEKLEIVHVSPFGTMSVLVQYSRASVAQEAKECLTGQLYGSHRIEARFVKLPLSGNIVEPEGLSASGVTAYADKKTSLPSSLSTDLAIVPQREIFPSQTDWVSGLTTHNTATFNATASGCGTFPRQDLSSILLPTRTSLAAINSPFLNVFDDPNDIANSRWCGPSQNVERARQYASSNQMHFTTTTPVYSNTAA